MATETLAPIDKMTRKQANDEFTSTQLALKAITDKPDDDWTADDLISIERLKPRCEAIKAHIGKFGVADSARQAAAENDRFARTAVLGVPHPAGGPAYKAKGDDGASADGRVDNGASETDKFLEKGPFKSLGHFGHIVRTQGGGQPGLVRDGLLGEWNAGIQKYDRAIKAMDVKADASGLSELADSEGAVAVPVTIVEGLWQRVMTQANLLSYLSPLPVAGNALSLSAYADDSRADGSRMGGVQGYWDAEAGQYTKSKPTFRKVDYKLHKLTLLVWMTQELMDDSPMAMDAELTRLASEEFTFKINDALTRGLGVGMPMGYLASPCKITQGAVSGQGASTIVGTNIDNMWARRANPQGLGYMWVANQDTETQLAQLNYTVSGTNSVAATWLYLPAGGITGAPTPQLKGKPVIFTEQAETLGTEGDLTLIDWSQWGAIVKSTGIRSSVSMHLRFDYDELAFKFSYRMDAKPRWEKALTRFKGSNTLSPIVTLSSTRT